MTESGPTTARLSPLDEVHRASGASFTDFAGWQMPVRYSSDLAEHHAVRERAGLFDLSHMGEIVVFGPEAGAALDAALAGKLSAIAEGQAKYSLLLNDDGGIVDDLVVYRTGADRFMIVANAANREVVAAELRERAAGFDAEVFDESDDVALIALQGPDALEVLQETPGFGVDGPGNDEEDFDARLAELKYYRAFAATFEDRPVLVARTGYTGEDGFELYLAPDRAPGLWQALRETGGSRVVPCGLASRDTLRLEAGMPLYGHELTTTTFPVQAGLGRVVALGKDADFVGRAAVERGPGAEATVLVGLTADGRRAPRAGYEVYDGEGADASHVGAVTSGALSPTLGHPVAMAYVAPDLADAGTRLFVDVRGTRVPATVVDLPFYRRPE
ncbi:glycine cleavage system aminomethyltransferase GcvT [Agromyces aerolatus]|uniref:glycine cleavage system aminomethyltransferase GcvT n=1 Tax=Agromyces sp. LY-1074 TaxID=3074080 RepID=UPI0028590F66|nr:MULTISPECIES: glycine cleavage system aminomethyltransferase GcvT [unclassified Agromyces]MDR5698893.1 glycine cleavage system aminomethyltransferase GcvT [Agromyces sp. LY-1074]MDR5705329.1 glycine cleavage system aminomethyltransferase GcvT [Agromyces sp. LY-1358]